MIRQIRKSVEKNGPVIAVAAYDWSAIKVKALEAGADVFLQKPLFASTLYDLLLSLTQDRPLACDANPEEGFDGERVLLVEDNALNLEIAVTLLTTRKLQVDTARNGQEAVENSAAAKPDITLPSSWISKCRSWTALRPPGASVLWHMMMRRGYPS